MYDVTGEVLEHLKWHVKGSKDWVIQVEESLKEVKLGEKGQPKLRPRNSQSKSGGQLLTWNPNNQLKI